MSIATAPPRAEALVQRLLTTEEARRRRALIDRVRLTPSELQDAARQLLANALPLFGSDPVRMARLSEDARALAERAGDAFLQAIARMQEGDALRAQRRDAEACACYDEAAAAFTRLGHPVEAARTRIGWMDSMAKLGRPDEALAAAGPARRVLAAAGATVHVASLEGTIGLIHIEHGSYRAAFRRFSVALGLSRSLGEAGRLGVARSHQNRSLALIRLGRHREALTDLERARETFERAGETAGAARVTRSIGLVQVAMGRYGAALGSFGTARALFQSVGLERWLAGLACDAADCYLALNRPAEAVIVLDGAAGGAQPIENVQTALGIATRLVVAYRALDRHDEALAALNEVGRYAGHGAVQHRAWHAVQRAALLLDEGDATGALAAARHAQDLARAVGMRRLMSDAAVLEGGALLATGQVGEAGHAATRAVRLARQADAPSLLYRAYELLGQIAQAEGRLTAARRRYAAAIAALEREQQGVIFEFRDSFASNRGEAYERLAVLQLRAGRPADALLTAERAKSRALSDAIGGVVEPRPRGSAAIRRLARELRVAREDYAAAAAERERARLAGAALEDEETDRRLAVLETRIAGLVQRLQIAGADADLTVLNEPAAGIARPAMPAGTALLEFFFSGDDLLRFLVDATGVHGEVRAGAVPEVERLLRLFRLNLDAAERATPERLVGLAAQARGLLGRLHEKLLGGLDRLPTYVSLVIVPHGLLHYLPFHALFDGERHLIERVPVSYAPSAAIYAACRARLARRVRRGAALVLGHSWGGRLPFTREEAEEVGDILGSPVFLEDAATRGLIAREGRRAAVVHIAAHGRFRPDAPLFSSVELADGPLTTADVYDLDLRGALVTLSACETGRAVLGGGDELAGLARAFLYAGAAGLLVSQWRVDDATTFTLMGRFYRAIGKGAAPTAALRSAQLACIAGDVHPLSWAAFQIVGDGGEFERRPREARKGYTPR